MNDFAIDITDFVGFVKPRSFALPKNATEQQRAFYIASGPGTSPATGTQRKIRGHWVADNMKDTISSYDFEYVRDKNGKKVERTPEEQLDVQPVMLESEIRETKTTLVRRKK
jgi:hypothetical protein